MKETSHMRLTMHARCAAGLAVMAALVAYAGARALPAMSEPSGAQRPAHHSAARSPAGQLVPIAALPSFAQSIKPSGPIPGRLPGPNTSAVLADYAYGCMFYANACNVYFAGGTFAGTIGSLVNPQGAVVDKHGQVYIANTGAYQIPI
jgi:hypothetical protein